MFCVQWFRPLYSSSPVASCNASTSTQMKRGRSQNNTDTGEHDSVKINAPAYALGHPLLHILFPLSRSPHSYFSSGFAKLLPKATLTSSIKLHLGLPGTWVPLTSAMHQQLLAMRCTSILSMWANHLKTFCSPSLFLFQLFYAHFYSDSIDSCQSC